MAHILKDGESFHYDASGRLIGTVDRNGNEIVEDGQSVRVPMLMMDGARPSAPPAPTFNADHARPRQGVRSLEDQARSIAARHKMIERTGNAWKKEPAPPLKDRFGFAMSPTAEPTLPDASAAYDRMRERLENRWKNPKPIL